LILCSDLLLDKAQLLTLKLL